MQLKTRVAVFWAGAMLALMGLGPALAQDFYKGKTITLMAGFPVGGGVDREMRTVTAHLRKFIPGQPAIVPRNMPGAGGIVLGNHIYGIAAPDGLTIAMPGRSGFLLAPAVGDKNARYNLEKFTWIGTSAPANLTLWLRKEAGIRTLAELRTAKRELVIGGLSAGSTSTVIPLVLAKYEHLPLKVVQGYPGFAEAILAVERGEIDGIFTQAASFRPDLISSGEVLPIVQMFPMDPNVPALETIITEPRQKALFTLLSAPSRLGLPLLGPPGMPDEATKILREAYYKMASSKEFQEEAAKQGIEVGTPSSGEELEAYVAKNLTGIAADIVEETLSYTERK